jgi:hypothetical protein
MTLLEAIKTWKPKIIKATDLPKLLRRVIKKKQLLRYGQYDFPKRAQDLAKRLEEAKRLERLERLEDAKRLEEAKSTETSN